MGLCIRDRVYVSLDQVGKATVSANDAVKGRVVGDLLGAASDRKDNDPVVSLRLGLAALALENNEQTRGGLVATLTAGRPFNTVVSGRGTVRSVAFGPDGLLLTADDTGVELRNVSKFSQLDKLSTFDFTGPARIATMSQDGRVVLLVRERDPSLVDLWDTSDTRNPTLKVSFHTCGVVSAAVNSARSTAMTGCADGTAELWDIRDLMKPTRLSTLTPKPAGLRSVALNTAGTIAFVGSDQGLAIWDVTDQTKARSITSTYAQVDNIIEANVSITKIRPVRSVASDSTGSLVVAAMGGGRSQIARNARDNRVIRGIPLSMDNNTTDVEASALSNDGRIALTTGANNDVVVWETGREKDADQYSPKLLLSRHTAPIVSVAISPDRHTAVTGSKDGSAVLWNLSAPDRYHIDATIPRFTGRAKDLTCSRQTTMCATIDKAGQSVLWDMADPTHPQRLTGLRPQSGAVVSNVAFAPSSAIVAIGGVDGTVDVLDVSTPGTPLLLGSPPVGHGAIRALALTPDGKAVAVGSEDGEVSLWKVNDSKNHRTLVPGGRKAVRALALDSTGKLLAAGWDSDEVAAIDISVPTRPGAPVRLPSQPGKVRALSFQPDTKNLLQANDAGEPPTSWNLADPATPTTAKLAGTSGKVNSLAYNRTGSMAITVSDDDTATVWNTVDPRKPAMLARLVGHTGSVLSAAFSSDGTVITGSEDASIIVWNIEALASITRDPRPTACEAASGAFTPAEWMRWIRRPEIEPINNC